PTLPTLFLSLRPPPRPTLFPYTTLFRSRRLASSAGIAARAEPARSRSAPTAARLASSPATRSRADASVEAASADPMRRSSSSCRSEEHTSELQSHLNLVCRLLLEKKKNK